MKNYRFIDNLIFLASYFFAISGKIEAESADRLKPVAENGKNEIAINCWTASSFAAPS